MTDTKKNQSINVAFAAGAVGAAVGAASVYMMDKNNQKKVAKSVTKLRQWSEKTVDDLKKKDDPSIEVGGKSLDEKAGDIKETAKKSTKDQLESISEQL